MLGKVDWDGDWLNLDQINQWVAKMCDSDEESYGPDKARLFHEIMGEWVDIDQAEWKRYCGNDGPRTLVYHSDRSDRRLNLAEIRPFIEEYMRGGH